MDTTSALPEKWQKPMSPLRRGISALVRSPVLLALVVVPIIYAATGIAGLVEHASTPVSSVPESVQIDSWTRPASLKSELKSTLDANPELTAASIDHTLERNTIFSSVVLRAVATRQPQGQISYRFFNTYRFQAADFVALFGVWLVLIYLYIQWSGVLLKLFATVKGIRLPSGKVLPLSKPSPSIESQTTVTDEAQSISQDMAHGRKRADEIFYRSTILLIGGVAMAFIGVLVFYFSVRDVPSNIGGGALAIEIIRPGSMLIFLEAVAWFLLNQYRLQSHEYRAYHDKLAKRAELLAAIYLVRRSGATEHDDKLMAALLTPSSDTVLRTGETTHALESERIGATNPMFELMRDLVKKLPNAVIEPKKDA